MWSGAIFVMLSVSGLVFADDLATRALLLGQWESQDGAGQSSVWTIERKGEALRVAASKGDQKLLEYECKPSGVDCDAWVSGKRAKISMYFNGPALVQIETKGSEITKRRFLAKDHEMIDLEVIPVVPGGNSHIIHLKRVHE
jgi:hypothetical protein